MPIEIEYKYVVDPSLEEMLKQHEVRYYDLHQIYLEKGIRFRSITDSGYQTFEFTYKTKINVGHLEINKFVSKQDFEIALTKATTILQKRRYCIQTVSHLWEIDFFYDDNVYFGLMECEVEDNIHPDISELPEYVQSKILKKVTLDDSDYSSFKLANKHYAEKLLKNIKI